MCIITSKVENVSNTKIYASANEDNTRQLTIYSNEVSTKTHNAMILPVPNPDSVQFHNFETYPSFFEDCEKCFRSIPTRSAAHLTASFRMNESLPVYKVGSYLASIVPRFEDFMRLDRNLFELSNELLSMLSHFYDQRFGFIVCILKKGTHNYHPFAYSHDLLEPSKLFLPTRHYHPGEAGATADWDHIIYSPITNLNSCEFDSKLFSTTEPIQWKKMPNEFRWAYSVPLCRWTKHGDWMNKDLLIESFYKKRVY